MAEQTTRVLLEVKWDPDVIDHPSSWLWREICASNPFEPESEVRMISFEDVDVDGRPEQV